MGHQGARRRGREVWNDARRAGQKAVAKELEGARYALWKNPEDLTERQQAKLADIAKTNKRLYRAYLLKEQLRKVFHQDTAEQAITLLDEWLAWASRSKLPAFVKLARSIREHKTRIHAALTHGLSNARVESMNQKLRLIMRRAFGFRSVEALIGLAMLAHGGLCPPLPAESRRRDSTHGSLRRPGNGRHDGAGLRPGVERPWGHTGTGGRAGRLVLPEIELGETRLGHRRSFPVAD